MTPALRFEELLGWNEESAAFWKAYFDANPALLQLPCDIGGTANVQEFVRHIWGVELRWGQRLAELPVTDRENMPTGPLEALFDLHLQAGSNRMLLIYNRFHRNRGPCRDVRCSGTRSCTASAIGRNWLH